MSEFYCCLNDGDKTSPFVITAYSASVDISQGNVPVCPCLSGVCREFEVRGRSFSKTCIGVCTLLYPLVGGRKGKVWN